MTTIDSGRNIFEMAEQDNKLVFQYWGKADDKQSAGPQWPPLMAASDNSRGNEK